MNAETELGWNDFGDAELAAAVIEVADRLSANVGALVAELAAKQSEIYISPDARAAAAALIALKLRRTQDDLIAVGQVLEYARAQRSAAPVSR